MDIEEIEVNSEVVEVLNHEEAMNQEEVMKEEEVSEEVSIEAEEAILKVVVALEEEEEISSIENIEKALKIENNTNRMREQIKSREKVHQDIKEIDSINNDEIYELQKPLCVSLKVGFLH